MTFSSSHSWSVPVEENKNRWVDAEFADDAGNVATATDFIYYDAVRTVRIAPMKLQISNDSDPAGKGEIMRTVLILGAGRVTGPIVDYLTGKCGYNVTMAARTMSKAARIITGNPLARAVPWKSQEEKKLDKLIAGHDMVINMIPKAHHVMAAQLCLKHRKHMVTTSYEIPPVKALDARATIWNVPAVHTRTVAPVPIRR